MDNRICHKANRHIQLGNIFIDMEDLMSFRYLNFTFLPYLICCCGVSTNGYVKKSTLQEKDDYILNQMYYYIQITQIQTMKRRFLFFSKKKL